jgi:hypothetical protein
MRRNFYLFFLLFIGMVLNAQDDIYDAPERVKPRVVYSNQNPSQSGDGSYENLDDDFNPDYDYRYRRSLRRMYDPYYVMPSSAYLNMYTYPQFSNFYNPYWGSGFSITIGNTWGQPMGWNSWNNPWGWNSWNSWYAWNQPWGWNNWGGGWNSWNNPWCGWNSWGGGWNSWGGGWNHPRWNGNGNNWNGGNRNSVTPPERRISRAVRVMDPNRDYGNTTYRPSQPQGNPSGNNSRNNTPTYRSTPSNNTPSQGTISPSPTRMGGNSPSGGGGSSGGGGRSGGRSGGSGRF